MVLTKIIVLATAGKLVVYLSVGFAAWEMALQESVILLSLYAKLAAKWK
jgi:hypothetical protein